MLSSGRSRQNPERRYMNNHIAPSGPLTPKLSHVPPAIERSLGAFSENPHGAKGQNREGADFASLMALPLDKAEGEADVQGSLTPPVKQSNTDAKPAKVDDLAPSTSDQNILNTSDTSLNKNDAVSDVQQKQILAAPTKAEAPQKDTTPEQLFTLIVPQKQSRADQPANAKADLQQTLRKQEPRAEPFSRAQTERSFIARHAEFAMKPRNTAEAATQDTTASAQAKTPAENHAATRQVNAPATHAFTGPSESGRAPITSPIDLSAALANTDVVKLADTNAIKSAEPDAVKPAEPAKISAAHTPPPTTERLVGAQTLMKAPATFTPTSVDADMLPPTEVSKLSEVQGTAQLFTGRMRQIVNNDTSNTVEAALPKQLSTTHPIPHPAQPVAQTQSALKPDTPARAAELPLQQVLAMPAPSYQNTTVPDPRNGLPRTAEQVPTTSTPALTDTLTKPTTLALDGAAKTLKGSPVNSQTRESSAFSVAPQIAPPVGALLPSTLQHAQGQTHPTPPSPALSESLQSTALTQQRQITEAGTSLLMQTEVQETLGWDGLRLTPTANQLMQPLRTDFAPHVARQLVEVMAQAAHRPVEITLAPQELGRVRMSVHTDDGLVTVNIIAERADTLDLMRRHIDQLGQSFRAMGYESISFAFSHGSDTGDTSGNSDAKSDALGNSALADTSTDQPDPTLIELDRVPNAGLDIRL